MKSILILGATSDMAVAIAHEYAAKGFSIVLAARNTDRLKNFQKDLEIRYSVSVRLVNFDASKFEEHEQFVSQMEDLPPITVCVFGYLGDQQVAQEHWKEAQDIINTNYVGAVSVLNHIAQHYEKQKAGSIAGISSVAGERGRQSNYIYGSAKAGFSAYLSGLRNRLHSAGVHVSTVKPGFVNTKMTDGLNLPGPLTAQPKQVAKAVYKAIESKKNIIYVLPIWRWIMLLVKNIPEGIFKKLKM